jgi:hypothetical protein
MTPFAFVRVAATYVQFPVFTALGDEKVVSVNPVPNANFPLLSIPNPQSQAPPPDSADMICINSQWFVLPPTEVVLIHAETVKSLPPSHECVPEK